MIILIIIKTLTKVLDRRKKGLLGCFSDTQPSPCTRHGQLHHLDFHHVDGQLHHLDDDLHHVHGDGDHDGDDLDDDGR